MLHGRIEDAAVLDLFAGSGSLGLEAWSRGAARVVFVERNRMVLSILRENVDTVASAADAVEIRVGEVLREVGRLGGGQETFDLVFLDPPYGKGLVLPTLQALVDAEVLRPGATVVVDHSSREEIEKNATGRLVFTDRRSYGEVAIALYRYKGEEEG
jgi:16S rRNA (guanine(966)-N(2))-methyltransferase RsmD